MENYDIEQHKKMIEIQLNNKNENEEEEIEKINEIVRNNLLRIFIETGVSMREFALLSDISASTFKRLFNSKKANLNLKSLLKLSVNLDIPIECLVSNLTPEDIELVKRFHQMDANQKKAMRSEIEKLTTHHRKTHKRQKMLGMDFISQINLFDYLQDIEKDEQRKRKEDTGY